MGIVFLAYDTYRKADIALKILPAGLATNPNFRQRFEREVQIIVSLEHHAVVPVYDFGEIDGLSYLAMRLMQGGALADRLKQRPLLISEIDAILQRICSALDKAHANGIIHRDIKPGNILFDDESVAFLADFGIASLTNSMTTHSLAGTPHYMAPEQAEGRDVTPQTDIYQLGVVLFEMLSGQTPYAGDTPSSLLYQHVHADIPNVIQINPSLPATAQTIIEKALSKQPKERFKSAGDLAAAFHAMALKQLKDSWHLRPAALFLLGGLIILLLLFMVFILTRNNSLPSLPTPYPIEAVTSIPAVVQSSPSLPSTALIESPTSTPSLTPQPTPSPTPQPSPTPTLPPDIGGGTGVIAYVSDQEGLSQIYLRAANTANATRLTNLTMNAYRPVWSPDGQFIAFHAFSNDNWDIYIINADGTGLRNLTNNPKDDSFPSWSPDGTKIAFHSNRAVDFEIFIMDANGLNPFPITNNEVDDFGPSWSPDGTAIAFDRRHGQSRQVYILSLSDFSERQIAFVGSNEFAAWSPDGIRLAFESDRDGNWEIYSANMDGSNLNRLTDTPADDFYVSWSPDGQWLAYQENINDNREIFLIRTDGTLRYQWTLSPANERQPAWQPLLRRLVPTAPLTGGSCPTTPGTFSEVWQVVRLQIGCPVGIEQNTWMALEHFERGQMIWRESYDAEQAVVLYNDGAWQIVPYQAFIDGIDPEFSCVDNATPALCPPTPKRGFGKMWCSNNMVRQRMGNALDCERGLTGTVQLFDRGFMLRTDEGLLYIFFGVTAGTWQQR